MKIGLAYYKDKDYAQAVSALDDFQRMHPTSKNLQLVSYYIAMSYFDQIGREDQDQTKTELALARFQTIEQRFPETEFAELAKEKSEICREVLARHQKVVGDYYFKSKRTLSGCCVSLAIGLSYLWRRSPQELSRTTTTSSTEALRIAFPAPTGA